MKINTGKVVVGGIIAGIVMVAIDFIINTYLLGPQYMTEMDAFKPGSSAAMMAGNAKFIYPLLDVILGIVLVWVYAAIRPRFGPGPRTAFFAALALWVVSCIAYYGYMQMGMMTSGTWWGFGAVGLIAFLLGSLAGAKFYSEEGTA